MAYALPEANRYTGSVAQINRAMFRDLDEALGLLGNVAGRNAATASTLARGHLGLTQADLTRLYETLNSFDPNNPHENRPAILQELREQGFAVLESARLLGNPTLLQMVARTACAVANPTQFGAIVALNPDTPAGPNPAITAADLRFLQTEMHLLATEAPVEMPTHLTPVDPMAPSIPRYANAFYRAQIFSTAILFNPASRNAMIGAPLVHPLLWDRLDVHPDPIRPQGLPQTVPPPFALSPLEAPTTLTRIGPHSHVLQV